VADPIVLSPRRFGIFATVVLGGVALFPLIRGGQPRAIPGVISLAILAAVLVRPGLLQAPVKIWVRITVAIALVVNAVILSIAFFVVVTPVALVLRLSGRDPLRLKLERGSGTYWIVREDAGPGEMSRQF